MIFVCNHNRVRLGAIKDVLEATRSEEINGENLLDFTATLSSKLVSMIGTTTVFEFDDDYFDLGSSNQNLNADGTYTIKIEADHISYRLNEKQYDLEVSTKGASFDHTGSMQSILTYILAGTGFTLDTFSVGGLSSLTYKVTEKISRRKLLMDFVEYIGGELQFFQFGVSVLAHRGSTQIQTVIKDRHVTLLSKTVDKRVLTPAGQPTISYKCTPIGSIMVGYALGDDLQLRNNTLGVSETMRVVKMDFNPYDPTTKTLELGAYRKGLSQALRDKVLEAKATTKELAITATDMGVRFIANETEIAVESGSDEDGWVGRLYAFEVDDTPNLAFNGVLTDGVIDQVIGETDERYATDEDVATAVDAVKVETIGAIVTVDIVATGDFVTTAWEHPYNTDDDEVFFNATPLYRLGYIIDWWAVDIVSATTVRVVGHATVVEE